MVIFIKIIGFLISVLPVSVLERITNFLGLLLVTIPNKRKRIIFSNLKYAFPEWDNCKDAADAAMKYGRLYTVRSILDSVVTNTTKIKVLARGYCR